mmetsp:Transcript_34231/g.62618  ORF Transcript_34231/g.62618 Transcript_34231/m.62618 type:complete len:125 (-) Transcript_34231:75-449(-)
MNPQVLPHLDRKTARRSQHAGGGDSQHRKERAGGGTMRQVTSFEKESRQQRRTRTGQARREFRQVTVEWSLLWVRKFSKRWAPIEKVRTTSSLELQLTNCCSAQIAPANFRRARGVRARKSSHG